MSVQITLPRTKLKAATECAAFVYFMRADGTSRCKVGLTRSIAARERSLSVGSADKLIVEAFIEFETRKQAQEIERKLHGHLKQNGRLLKGEWFRILPQEIHSLARVFQGREGVARVYCVMSFDSELTDCA